jgi:beta-lactamase regulating signal transducer with metallopeptidase domain
MRHALWLVVLLKLVMPPVVQLPLPVPNLAASVASLDESPQASPPGSKDAQGGSAGGVAEGPGGVAVLSRLDPSLFQRDVVVSQADWRLSSAVAYFVRHAVYLWLAGSVAVLFIQVLRMMRMRKVIALGNLAPAALTRKVATVASRLGIAAPVTLIVPRVGSPCVWGVGRPMLLWPENLDTRLPKDSHPAIIAHELAHLYRKDHWLGWLLLFAECIWWWNPIYWYVRGQLRLNAELACDAWVVTLLPEDRRAYAEALIEVSQHVSQMTVPAPALGMRSGARQVLERRLTMIMRDRVSCRVPVFGFAGVALLALLALPGWSRVQEQTPEKGKPAESPKVELSAEADTVLLDGAVDLDVILAFDDQARSTENREKKLKEVEQKLQTLLEEVRALRGEALKTAVKEPLKVTVGQAQPRNDVVLTLKDDRTSPLTKVITPQANLNVQYLTLDNPGADGRHSDTLDRTTYKLAHAKAEALGKFLHDQVKGQVMETKVDGDSITVTTTPEAQKAVGQIVSLLLEKKFTLRWSTTPAVNNTGYIIRSLDTIRRDSPEKADRNRKSQKNKDKPADEPKF